MKVLLEDVEVNKELFCVNDGLNFGRMDELKPKAYHLQLSYHELFDLIEKEYVEIRDEIKQDDETYSDTSDFSEVNYCSLSELLQYPASFEEIMKTYLNRTLLKKVFNNSTNGAYVINSTDTIEILNDSILITGNVFERMKE